MDDNLSFPKSEQIENELRRERYNKKFKLA